MVLKLNIRLPVLVDNLENASCLGIRVSADTSHDILRYKSVQQVK
jgi:hypothetical protein